MTRQRNKQGRDELKREKRTNRIVLVVCEGQETELQYFDGFKDEGQDFRLSVVKGKNQDPVDLVRDAIRLAEKEGLRLGEQNGDTAWCVFDVDQSEDQRLLQAKQLADRHHVDIAISNPCFEIWFLLHFRYTTSHFQNSRAVIQALSVHEGFTGYQKNKNVFDILNDQKQDVAVSNAMKLEKYHEAENNDPFSRSCNPSTQVYKLVTHIRSLKK